MYRPYLLSLLATTVSLSLAQTIVPTAGSSTFPGCAVGCSVLMQAQSVCTPPNAISSTQQYYNSCFCQAPTLIDLFTTGETLCTSQCTATADRKLLSTWFVNFCAQAGVTYGGTAATATSSTASSASASSSTQYTSPVSTHVVGLPSTDTRPWVQSHWQYIVMLIFLFFGLLGIGLGARWAKKRSDMKKEQKRAAMSGFPSVEGKDVDRESGLTPDLWEPHQHMTAAQSHQFAPNGTLPIISEDRDNEKSKRGSRVEVTEVQPVPPPVHTKAPKDSSS